MTAIGIVLFIAGMFAYAKLDRLEQDTFRSMLQERRNKFMIRLCVVIIGAGFGLFIIGIMVAIWKYLP